VIVVARSVNLVRLPLSYVKFVRSLVGRLAGLHSSFVKFGRLLVIWLAGLDFDGSGLTRNL
jgi:hypothetical protein